MTSLPLFTAPNTLEEEYLASDDEHDDPSKDAITVQRLAEYNAKKASKPKPIAKSMVIYDVKPWDEETDMVELESTIKGISLEGLLWGSTQLVEIGYGIKKLQIVAVVEDEKVGVDELADQIASFEDAVSSVDVVSFNKI